MTNVNRHNYYFFANGEIGDRQLKPLYENLKKICYDIYTMKHVMKMFGFFQNFENSKEQQDIEVL